VERLKQKVALVTGGASGLGKAIAQRLAAEGARVVITDIQATLGEAVAAELSVGFLSQDVTNEARWSEVIGEIQKRHGGLHILVNNAGIFGARDRVSPEDILLEEWRRVFAANVESVLLGCRAAIPLMAASGGSIVNIASTTSMLATPYATAYGAGKATVRHITKSVAQHCLERGLKIRCNSVHPGVVRTAQWDRQAEESARKRGVALEVILNESRAPIPMGEFVEAEEVAAAVAFLACDETRHMTGAKLVIDGGAIACNTFHLNLSRRMGLSRGKPETQDR
jgi:3(or 17)beta-hydroxysteroid dehydrogenase